MGEIKQDEHGEYDEDAGSPHPVDPDEVNYEPCNAVLRHTWSRYGERRYCSGMAVSNFEKHAETSYEHPQFCKHHQSRAELMKRHEDAFKTGAHAKSHEHIFQHMPPHKQIIANDLYKSLVAESTYDFEMEEVELEIDVSRHDFAGPEVDVLVLDHKVPTEHQMRAKALWFASLDFMTVQSIKEEQFRVSAEEDYEGRSLAVGERTTLISGENGPVEITDEHHLNLPLSRVQKDYERHLQFGGVEVESEASGGDMSVRDFVLEVEPDEEEMQPESKSSDSSPLTEIEAPDED